MIAPVVPMDSTAANVWYRCLSASFRVLGLRDLMAMFESVDRLSCSDGDSSIMRAERGFQVATGIPTARFPCVLHLLAADRCRSLTPVLDVMDYLRPSILSVRLGGGIRMFRQAFTRVFLGKARRGLHRTQQPSASQRASNEARLRLFCKPSKRKETLALLKVLTLLPGDWDDSNAVPHPPWLACAAIGMYACNNHEFIFCDALRTRGRWPTGPRRPCKIRYKMW